MPFSNEDENQRLLDELIASHKSLQKQSTEHDFLEFTTDFDHYKQRQPPSTLDSNYNNIQAYQGFNPAQHHEKLSLISNNKSNSNTPNSQRTNHYHMSKQRRPDDEQTSFLDDMFTNSHFSSSSATPFQQDENSFDHRIHQNSISNANTHEHSNSFSLHTPELDHLNTINGGNANSNEHESENTSSSLVNDHITSDFLFNQRNEEGIMNYTDDLSSSLGSSVNSDFLSSSYNSSSFSFNPHNLDTIQSLTSNGANYSPNIRSPPSSIRAGNYLSTSLRQANTVGTPKSRNASISVSINNTDSLSTSVPKSLSHLSAEEKLKRKRDFHNAVERRRRDLIKQKIKELGNLVPPSLLCFDSKGKQVKPNKGIILNKTVDYIHFLLDVLEAQNDRKMQLNNKIDEIQDKFSNIKFEDNSNTIVNDTKVNEVTHDDERIIDTRVRPQNEMSFAHVNDDLKQFLSGDAVEAEDNARLMFNLNSNPADYLLKFD